MSKGWQVNRRTLLKGLGVSCALPSLEAMAAPKARPKRLCVIYTPNGVSIPEKDHPAHAEWGWFPQGSGRDYRFTKTLESLEPHRSQLTVVGGLSHPRSRDLLGHAAGDTFLTGGDIRGEYK